MIKSYSVKFVNLIPAIAAIAAVVLAAYALIDGVTTGRLEATEVVGILGSVGVVAGAIIFVASELNP